MSGLVVSSGFPEATVLARSNTSAEGYDVPAGTVKARWGIIRTLTIFDLLEVVEFAFLWSVSVLFASFSLWVGGIDLELDPHAGVVQHWGEVDSAAPDREHARS